MSLSVFTQKSLTFRQIHPTLRFLNSLFGLENLSTIGGDVLIGSQFGPNNSLASLMGLEGLTFIGGDLKIGSSNLISLTGLNNLSEIGGSLSIGFVGGFMTPAYIGNTYLNDISALGNLISVGENLEVFRNDSLTSLTGLENLTKIPGDIFIGGDFLPEGMGHGGNYSLINLSGLNNLDSIGGNLLVLHNTSMIEFSGLNNLAQVGGSIVVKNNPSLLSFQGFESLSIIEGSFVIGDSYPFSWGHPSLESFNGRDNLNFIGNNLVITSNEILDNLSGLDNLISVGGNISIYKNDALVNLNGLDNLTSILGNLAIEGNSALCSLTGLENLISLGGNCWIQNNSNLPSLIGIEGIDAVSIDDLKIFDNASLSHCHVQSICEYLVAPNGEISIYNNAPGCNTIEEVEEACDTITVVKGIFDLPKLEVAISPNPVTEQTLISFNSPVKSPTEIFIYNTTGTCISNLQLSMDQKDITINMTDYPAGIYLCKIMVENEVITRKIIKQ